MDSIAELLNQKAILDDRFQVIEEMAHIISDVDYDSDGIYISIKGEVKLYLPHDTEMDSKHLVKVLDIISLVLKDN